jgi:hypothetical protein
MVDRRRVERDLIPHQITIKSVDRDARRLLEREIDDRIFRRNGKQTFQFVRPALDLDGFLPAPARASAGSSTGVLPLFTMCCGPRTEAAGLVGTTCRTDGEAPQAAA